MSNRSVHNIAKCRIIFERIKSISSIQDFAFKSDSHIHHKTSEIAITLKRVRL